MLLYKTEDQGHRRIPGSTTRLVLLYTTALLITITSATVGSRSMPSRKQNVRNFPEQLNKSKLFESVARLFDSVVIQQYR